MVDVDIKHVTDLGGCEVEEVGEVLPLGCGEVALLPEPALQLVRLRLGEQHAPLLLLGGSVLGAVAVRLVRHVHLHRLVILLLLDAVLEVDVICSLAAGEGEQVWKTMVVMVVRKPRR